LAPRPRSRPPSWPPRSATPTAWRRCSPAARAPPPARPRRPSRGASPTRTCWPRWGGDMTPIEIRALIAATPAALALVDAVRGDAAPAPDTAAIAAAISAGRTRIMPRPVGDGDIALALGVPAGPLFLYQLETVASTPPEAGASADAVAQFATARQAWRSLQKGSFDVGNPGVRSAIDLFVGTLLSAEQAVAVKALAEVPDPISEWDVRCAVLADDGGLLV